MNHVLIDDGRVENPASRVDLAAAAICQQGCGGSSQIANPDVAGLSVPFTSDSIGLGCDAANATIGADRSADDNWRVAVHESGHVLIHRLFSNVVSVTIVPDGECSGKTWWPEGVDAAAVAMAGSAISDPGVSRDGDVGGVFSIVQRGVIAMMGGCAAEMTLLGDAPPKYIGSDVPNAGRIAGVVCRTTASIAAFVEHGYQEALALVDQHKTVVIAIARALIDHPKRTLDGAEIDAVIAPALAAKAAADEHKRRADWAKVLTNAAEFTARETQSEG